MNVSVRVLLTERCNLSCVFCHNEGQAGTSEDLRLSPQLIGRLLNEFARKNSVQAKLSGGEPTSHPRFDEFLLACQQSAAKDVVVITNGSSVDRLVSALTNGKIRVSVNLPSAGARDYERLTGGDWGTTERSIRRLIKGGVPTALNSYWPRNRTPRELGELVAFAQGSKATLKILHPCQITDEAVQNSVLESLANELASLGYRWNGSHYHVSTYERGGHFVRLQAPYCPRFCSVARNEERTVRISASGHLHSCLDRDQGVLRPALDETWITEQGLQSVLDRCAMGCSDMSMNVPIVGRKHK